MSIYMFDAVVTREDNGEYKVKLPALNDYVVRRHSYQDAIESACNESRSLLETKISNSEPIPDYHSVAIPDGAARVCICFEIVEEFCDLVLDEAASEQYMGPILRCTSCNALLPAYFTGPYHYCPNCRAKVNKIVGVDK